MEITIHSDLSCSPDNGNVSLPSSETLKFKDPQSSCVICFGTSINNVSNPLTIPNNQEVSVDLSQFPNGTVIQYQPYASGTTTCPEQLKAVLDHTITIDNGPMHGKK